MQTSKTTNIPPDHFCHPAYVHPVARAWSSNLPRKGDLVYPIFVVEGKEQKVPQFFIAKQAISSMPKVYRYSVDLIVDALKPLVDKGLAAVLIFGIVDASLKDEIGTYAGGRGYQSAVHHALQQLALAYPNLLLITDVCLCAYTSHGHCGILDSKGDLDNGASITRLAEVALSHVKAGAHMVAPSDMMDGRVLAIKQALIDEGLRVPVMAYSAKFCSGLYGPFRDVCNSAPSKFDRSSYQLPVGSKQLAIKAVERDLSEGADFVMVKPITPYLDIVADIKQRFPTAIIACYHVSGEYSMLCKGAEAGLFDEKRVVLEYMESFRRAGVTIIITYFTPQLLEWL